MTIDEIENATLSELNARQNALRGDHSPEATIERGWLEARRTTFDLAFYQECGCGSGEYKEAQYDARGIFLTDTCPKCHSDRMREFRDEVLTDPNYACDEEVDGDYDASDWRE